MDNRPTFHLYLNTKPNKNTPATFKPTVLPHVLQSVTNTLAAVWKSSIERNKWKAIRTKHQCIQEENEIY